MKNITLENIKNAKKSFWDFISTTPLEYSERLSKKYKANIYLKREDLQPVRSYKIRWAFNKINSLTKEQKNAWVVCASAWNHAQWFAITCAHLKIKWAVFMQVTTPEQKVYKTKQFWWKYIEVFLIWDTFDEAFKASKEYQEKTGTSFVHPFDDPKTIEWQSTIALEIFEYFNKPSLNTNGRALDWFPDYIICPIWWWWVISWIISWTKVLSPKTKIIWAEPAWASAMKYSLERWTNSELEKIDIFVDWAAVKKEWDLTFEIAHDYNLEVVTCPENRVCSTILEYLKEDWIVIEPAWALSTDALKDLGDKVKWKTVVLIISWWNFDFERLPEVKERSMKYEWLKRYFVINFPQRPWALKDFLNCLWENDDIERFEYLKKSAKNNAPVFIWLKTDDKNNWKKITSKMEKMWFKYNDITDNDLYFDLLI